MNGRDPWEGGQLKLASRCAKDVFELMDEHQARSFDSNNCWSYMALAPHFQSHHGLLRELRSQVLESFPCERLAGYELGDSKLPSDFDELSKPGQFLLPFMKQHRQAFFHASDAYGVAEDGVPKEHELGHRFTWLKLASPTIDAIRQAFLANGSRLRVAFKRGANDALEPRSDPPTAMSGTRPWLRAVKVKGSAAFFGGDGEPDSAGSVITLNPDLTCLIGGSMTGKSTLLDGLRVHTGAEPPRDSRLRGDVEARAARFLAGQPDVQLDVPGSGLQALDQQWPAVFYTQNELQHLAQDPDSLELILAHILPSERDDIIRRHGELAVLDEALATQASSLRVLLEEREKAEEELRAAKQATAALNSFRAAGLPGLRKAEKLADGVSRLAMAGSRAMGHIEEAATHLRECRTQTDFDEELHKFFEERGESAVPPGILLLEGDAQQAIDNARKHVGTFSLKMADLEKSLRRLTTDVRRDLERKLAAAGHNAEELAEFQTLSARAGKLHECIERLNSLVKKIEEEEARFKSQWLERAELVEANRAAYEHVADAVFEQGQGIRVRRVDGGITDVLEKYIYELRQKGLTQWWNNIGPDQKPTPEALARAVETDGLRELGMSKVVAERARQALGRAEVYELKSVRARDRYVVESRVGDGYREIDRLSGGRRVSVLLSLLLEAHDSRPLVIDQPEDELDNSFLWKQVLPALQRLKGKRQVVIATHNANIVVNADADLVVRLIATAEHGAVDVSGAIEQSRVRNAILDTVDGGAEAFELRKAKYGF
jgi:hypothetical protein